MTPSTLRPRLPGLLQATLAGLLVGVLGWFGLHHYVQYKVTQSQFERLTATAQQAVRLKQRIRQQLLEMSDAMALWQRQPGCDDPLIRTLQQGLLKTPGIRALGRVEGQTLTCASAAITLSGLELGSPANTRRDGIRLWHVYLPDEAQRQQHYILLESQQLAMLLFPAEQFAQLNDANTAVAVYESAGASGKKSLTSFISEGLPENWLIPVNGTHPVLITDPLTGTLRVYLRADNGGAIALVTMPKQRLDNRVAAEMHRVKWWLILPMLLAGIVVILLRRSPFIAQRELERALTGDGMFLLYQPVIDLQSNRPVAVEALLRWKTDEDQILTPDLFLPLVESLGMSAKVTDKVCQLLCQDMPTILSSHPGFMVGLNVAAQELSDMRLAKRMHRLKKDLELGPGQLVVELTESSLVEADMALLVIEAMRKNGIQIAIDDFGTGYCSLSYLSSIPFDIIKIDRSFVTASGTDTVIGPIANHVVNLSKAMGVDCLAEGIESAEQSAKFQDMGVKYAQGYFHGRPMPIAELSEFLKSATKPSRTTAENVTQS